MLKVALYSSGYTQSSSYFENEAYSWISIESNSHAIGIALYILVDTRIRGFTE